MKRIYDRGDWYCYCERGKMPARNEVLELRRYTKGWFKIKRLVDVKYICMHCGKESNIFTYEW
jgi:hypothetical protein